LTQRAPQHRLAGIVIMTPGAIIAREAMPKNIAKTGRIREQGKVYARLSGIRIGAVPIITIEDAAAAVPLARALVTGGLRVVEITLRTDAAVDAAPLSRGTGGCGRRRDRADAQTSNAPPR
jgi:hypothetical protein